MDSYEDNERIQFIKIRIDIRPLTKDQWQEIFKKAGFVDVYSSTYKISLWEQFISHVKVDGFLRYLSTLIQSFSDPTIRAIFFNKNMLQAMRQYSSYIGYGLYVNRKV